MTNHTDAYQTALKNIMSFFVIADEGIAAKDGLLQYLATNISAMKRHGEDPLTTEILEKFCEELLGLSNVDSTVLRETLRLHLTWKPPKQP
ncbi:hypothetical protein [Pseudoalteromonas sp. ASV78]|uniref:hypothetical protein n=1 Tax=Pseudoalteromonas sp. ASV78 TaxID=3397851 RepID=UPI0039FD4DEC